MSSTKQPSAYFIDGPDVDGALSQGARLYLTGHLGREQPQLSHIRELADDTEVAITRYPTLTIDGQHYHTRSVEFAFVLSGTYAVRIIPTGEVRVLNKYGLCVIEPGLPHVCIAHPGTEVFLVKVPGGNDKEVVALDDASQRWIEEYRSDPQVGRATYPHTTESHARPAAFFVDGKDVASGLQSTNRLYLTGHLEREQPFLRHISGLAGDTEVGMTRYATLAVDQPHLHPTNVDFSFVLKGTFAVRIIPTGEVRVLKQYGLCVIEPGVAHVCIAHPGTEVLFVKVPGGNDKAPVEHDEGSERWIESYRTGQIHTD